MSLLTNQIAANTNKLFFLLADVSTLTANSISTGYLRAGAVDTSTITTSEVNLDNQVLTATSSELLLNGIPLATLSSLSSLADWSLEPAISTVNMDGNNIVGANTITATNGFFQNLMVNNVFAVSTYTSTISSLAEVADFGMFQTLSTGAEFASSISTVYINTDTINARYSVGAQEGDFSTLRIPGNIGLLLLDNGGSQFGASAEIRFDWYTSLGSNTSMFYDTTISSVRLMTHIPSGYTDALASRLHVPEMSASSITVSSINGSEFTASSLTIELVGVSSLVASSISSLGSELRSVFTSSIQFNAGGLNPSFNFDVGTLTTGLKSGLTAVGVGIGSGLALVASGIMASAFARRQGTTIVYNTYEQYATPSQLQFSTIGETISSYTRFVSSSSGEGNTVPGQEIFISTIIPAGSVCLRSLGDPVNLVDPSTFTSSIQAFGQWVQVPLNDAPSTISTFSTLYTSSLTADVVSTSYLLGANANLFGAGLQGLEIDASNLFLSTPQVVHPGFFNGSTVGANRVQSKEAAISSLTVSTLLVENTLGLSSLSTAYLLGANPNLFGLGVPGLEIDAANLFLSTPQIVHPGYFNGSTIAANAVQSKEAAISSLTVSTLGFGNATGLSSLMSISSSIIPGVGTSTTTYLNTDLSLLQNDIYCQQVRVGYGQTVTGANTEVIWYAPNSISRGIGIANNDATLRIQSTINAGTNNGYLLDTAINPPLFSTVNGTSTAVMAWLPSTNSASIGISTFGYIPQKSVIGGFSSASTQTLVANTPLVLFNEVSDITVGGVTLSSSAIVVPFAGNFELTTSIQFTKSGGLGTADFWFRVNGTDLPNSASQILLPAGVSGQTLGNVCLLTRLNAGDKVQLVAASPDSGVAATFLQSTVGAPYTRPAIPSIITTIRCLNY